MQVSLLKSKIHRATITSGNISYEGSLTIALDLMKKCGLVPYERILCSNMANGNRFETYAIPGDPGSGQIVLNGAAAFHGKTGDVPNAFRRVAGDAVPLRGRACPRESG